MQKLMDWMTNVFAPKMNKIARNPWLAAVQEAILAAMPVILIGSFATIFGILREYIPSLPDLTMLSNFSFGLIGLFLAYLVPATIMEKKKHRKTAKQAGMAGIALFLMFIYPTLDEAGNFIVPMSNFGSAGMLSALVAGILVAAVMNQFAKHSFFKEDTALPDFITVWFDTLIPITICLVFGWVVTFVLDISLFDVVTNIFSPFIAIGQSFWGFVLLNFIGYTFLYTFGISTWIIYPVTSVITLQAIGANIDAVAAGGEATFIHTAEACNLFLIGGGGTTLALGIMLLMAKSNRLKAVGRASIVPSICNINEPLVYGAPIAFNPILMVPMWIIGLIGPIITWFALDLGFVPIPAQVFNFWYLPSPIVGYLVTGSISGTILVLIIFAISWIIYYPFFKVYDNQCVAEEKEEEEKKAKIAARKVKASE